MSLSKSAAKEILSIPVDILVAAQEYLRRLSGKKSQSKEARVKREPRMKFLDSKDRNIGALGLFKVYGARSRSAFRGKCISLMCIFAS